MDCREAQDWILESAGGAPDDDAVSAHLVSCSDCQALVEAQLELDRRLSAALPQSSLGPEFRKALRRRIAREPSNVWPEWLPDLVLLASCTIVTLVCVIVLPFSAPIILGTGVLVTAGSYLFTLFLRACIETIEQF